MLFRQLGRTQAYRSYVRSSKVCSATVFHSVRYDMVGSSQLYGSATSQRQWKNRESARIPADYSAFLVYFRNHKCHSRLDNTHVAQGSQDTTVLLLQKGLQATQGR